MMRRAAIAGLAAFVALSAAPASAQSYPTRPIRVIVTTSPGGISDVFVRALSEPLHKRLGQPVVVENRAGGFMILGARACAEAPPDGYTFCVMPGEPLTYNQYTQKSLPYDPVKSFDPITNFFFITQALGVSSKLGVKSARRARRLFEGEGRHAVLFGAVVVAGLFHGELEEEEPAPTSCACRSRAAATP